MLKNDIQVLRKLANQLAELSALPIMKERKHQWYNLNARKVDKPMFLMGEFPWNEMNIDNELTLPGPLLQRNGDNPAAASLQT